MAKTIDQQPSSEQEKPKPKVKLVYIGPCTTTDKTLGGVFLPITEGQLAPLKIAYNQMVGHRRAVFLAQIIGYVTGRVAKANLRRTV